MNGCLLITAFGGGWLSTPVMYLDPASFYSVWVKVGLARGLQETILGSPICRPLSFSAFNGIRQNPAHAHFVSWHKCERKRVRVTFLSRMTFGTGSPIFLSKDKEPCRSPHTWVHRAPSSLYLPPAHPMGSLWWKALDLYQITWVRVMPPDIINLVFVRISQLLWASIYIFCWMQWIRHDPLISQGCWEVGTTEWRHFKAQGLCWWLHDKESTCQCGGHGFDPWSGVI